MNTSDPTAEILAQLAVYLTPSAKGSQSLPPAAYTDPGLFELERTRIFERSWFCVGREDEFAAPGDYRALSIVGEPIIVIRDRDGGLNALSNVCRHRLYPLVAEGSGSAKRLICNYHRWFYSLDGRLGGAPHMESTAGFDRTTCALPSFSVETWVGFVFVNLDKDAAPLSPRLEKPEAEYANHDIAGAVTVADYQKTWAGNWKLAVENASESYHHMGLHETSVQPYMPAAGTYVREGTDAWAYHRTPILAKQRAAVVSFPDAPTRLTDEDRAEMKVFTIFPAFVMLTVGEFTQSLSFIPLTVDQVAVRITSMLPAGALANDPNPDVTRAMTAARVDAINTEDELGTALLQTNAGSKYAARGWLSDKEGALPGFFAYLARSLCG